MSRPGAAARRTQRERRAETERRLLDAAARLIAGGGSRAVTLAAVGQAAGYSRGIVTHQFGSRQALLAALAQSAQQRIAPPADASPGLDRLGAIVTAYVGSLLAGDIRSRAFLLLWAESVAAGPDLRETFAVRDADFTRALADELEAAVRDGAVPPDLDVAGTALALMAQLRGIGLHALVGGDSFNTARARDAVVASVRRLAARQPS